MTECHRLCGLNNRHLFLTVLEAGKSKIKALADSMSGENPFLVSEGQLLSVSSYDRRDEGALWGPLYKGTNPICEGSSLTT